MDFRSRGNQQPVSQSVPASTPSASSNQGGQRNNWNVQKVGKWAPLSTVILLFSITVLVLAIAALLFTGGPNEAKSVATDKYQAVFLNNGQVYFGHVKDLNNKYINLKDIYYLQTNNANSENSQSTTTNSNVSLVKLGCELHAPYDQMIINSQQVIFWENLQDNGQVAKAITQYAKDNANKTCSTTSSSTQQAPSTSTQSSTSPTTTTTPTTNSTTTKKP